jgi:hypothetical protein
MRVGHPVRRDQTAVMGESGSSRDDGVGPVTEVAAAGRSMRRRGRRVSGAPAATTVAATVAAIAVGLALSTTEWGDHHLGIVGDVRVLGVVAAGALLFGAGLMELASWRVDLTRHHVRRGTALAAFGFSLAALVGLGHLVHDSSTVALLNPVTTTAAGVATLGFLAGTQRHRSVDPLVHVPLVLTTSAILVGGLVGVRALTGFAIDQQPTARVVVEISLTAGWLLTAYRSHRAGDGTAETALWAWFAVFWGMRAAAVQDVGWGAASGLLLVAIALVVLATASWELLAATDAERGRYDEAQAALAAAYGVIVHHEQRRHDIRHDARNAMLALRMSTYTLARHGELLDPETRERLSATVVEQVQELEDILGERVDATAQVTS